MSIVYLAGPIANIPGQQAIDWRSKAHSILKEFGIQVRDPMRSKRVVLGKQDRISNDFNNYADQGTFFTSKGIMTRDFNDVKQADALLVNLLGATSPSLGTVMEMAWAYCLQKPVVVCIEPSGNPHDNHPMLHEAMRFRVDSLEEGIYAVSVILGHDPYLDVTAHVVVPGDFHL